MRTQEEIIKEVLLLAQDMEEVRAVIQTDLVPVRKYLYTYNFYFIVEDVKAFEEDEIFKSCFGKRILLYRGDRNYPKMFPNTKAHLMVFKDGLTIVINVIDKNTFLEKYNGNNSCENVWMGDTFKKLLDKNEILPEIERLEEKKLLIYEIPTEQNFRDTCSEFYWVLKTFAEYTLRQEIPSAMFYLNISIRELLNRMLHWYICIKNRGYVEIGILDSNLEKLLGTELFQLYKKTYPSADYEKIWEAYEAVVLLWHIVGYKIANQCKFEYPEEAEREITEFIESLRTKKFQ